MGNTPQAEKGLLSLTAKIAGESQVFSPTKRGPYKDGDVIESGTHEELLAKKGFYADLYNSQFDQAS